jgi:hypothetical protein
MRALIGAGLALAALAPGAAAQNEAALRAAFEGKTVAVKLDMPATSQGVEVYPQDAMPVDFRQVAERLKDNGTALRMGDRVMITKVVVKRSSHIEFQLGGGGYGTFGDVMSDPSDVHTASVGETKEERMLRDSIKAARGPTSRKRFERDLANLRAERERENARAAAEAKQANAAQEANLRAKRAESGSRFNIRYRQGIPPEGLTPEGVMKALAQYVDFAGVPGAHVASAQPAAGQPAAGVQTVASNGVISIPANGAQSLAPTGSAPNGTNGDVAPAASGGLSSLRKGMALKDVESLLGPASTANEATEGSMLVMKRTYRKDGMKVSAKFVSDVLVDFTISPQ